MPTRRWSTDISLFSFSYSGSHLRICDCISSSMMHSSTKEARLHISLLTVEIMMYCAPTVLTSATTATWSENFLTFLPMNSICRIAGTTSLRMCASSCGSISRSYCKRRKAEAISVSTSAAICMTKELPSNCACACVCMLCVCAYVYVTTELVYS